MITLMNILHYHFDRRLPSELFYFKNLPYSSTFQCNCPKFPVVVSYVLYFDIIISGHFHHPSTKLAQVFNHRLICDKHTCKYLSPVTRESFLGLIS